MIGLFLLGLYMIISQVLGIIMIFGGMQNSPKWLKILVGIGQVLCFIGLLGNS